MTSGGGERETQIAFSLTLAQANDDCGRLEGEEMELVTWRKKRPRGSCGRGPRAAEQPTADEDTCVKWAGPGRVWAVCFFLEWVAHALFRWRKRERLVSERDSPRLAALLPVVPGLLCACALLRRSFSLSSRAVWKVSARLLVAAPARGTTCAGLPSFLARRK